MPMNVSSSELYNKANIFLSLIEYELNSLLGAYISVHIRFDLERYLLNIIFESVWLRFQLDMLGYFLNASLISYVFTNIYYLLLLALFLVGLI